jgi:glycosyltransferase involved in cell wall biosynthesis
MILLISKSVTAATGSAQSSQDMIRCIGRVDKELTVVSLESPPSNQKVIENLGGAYPRWIIFYNFPKHPKVNSFLRKLENIYWKIKYPYKISKTRDKINEIQYKYIIVNSIGSYTLFKNLKLNPAVPAMLVLRESPELLLEYKNWSIAKIKEVFFCFSAFVFVSNKIKIEWQKLGVLDGRPTFYIPNTATEKITNKFISVDKNIFRKELKLPENELLITCLASIQIHKGQDVLLKAFDSIHENFPHVKLLLVGGKSGSSEEIFSLMKNLSCSKKVMYMGKANPDCALKYLAASDVMVLPSRSEAMPRVILEAMAMKVPVVASSVGGIPELIINEKEGLLFESGDVYQCAIAIEKILSSPEKRSFYSLNAYNKYWDCFSREKQKERWENTIMEMKLQSNGFEHINLNNY